tara:strand:- start:1052 stop:1471 length:420 start_codon:yes stop_codon:yes gene_type:complete
MSKKRVEILETYYDEKKDLVQWMVRDVETDKKVVLCWPGSDLGYAVGVKQELPPKLIRKFCKDVEGKTINLVMEADIKELDVKDFGNLDEAALRKHHDVFDKYPYHEVISTLEEQNQFKDAQKVDQKKNKKYPSILDFE